MTIHIMPSSQIWLTSHICASGAALWTLFSHSLFRAESPWALGLLQSPSGAPPWGEQLFHLCWRLSSIAAILVSLPLESEGGGRIEVDQGGREGCAAPSASKYCSISVSEWNYWKVDHHRCSCHMLQAKSFFFKSKLKLRHSKKFIKQKTFKLLSW